MTIDVLARHNATVTGPDDAPTLVFGHGFGCDQTIWRRVAPQFEDTHRVVTFDHVGSGASDPDAYDHDRYATIDAYARDLVELARALDLDGATFVGHSISSMIGALASIAAPGRFDRLVMIGGSARYIDDPASGYHGGFSRDDVFDLLAAIDDNFVTWADAMAPVIMGNVDRPELAGELGATFAGLDANVAKGFARATFLTDVRDRLADVPARVLVAQCTDDAIVPDAAARFLHARLPDAELIRLSATGHCPLLSAPDEVVDMIRAFVPVPVAA